MKKIRLTRGKFATVDDSDYHHFSQHCWRAVLWGKTWYAARSLPREGTKRRLVLMHREILNTPEGLDTDHINGDGLDNRRENIRVSTKSQNQANRRNLQSNNTSGFKGVDFHRGKWRAQIKVDGRKIDLGSFDTPDEASGAYLRSAHHHFGKFAYPPLKEGK